MWCRLGNRPMEGAPGGRRGSQPCMPAARGGSGEPRCAAEATSLSRLGADGISNTVHPWAPASRPMDTVRPRLAHRGRARLRPPTASGARQPVAAVQVRWRWLRRCGGKPWREARPAAFLEVPCPLGPPARVVPPGSRCRRVERSSARLTGRGGERRGAVPPWRTTSERGCRPVPHDDGSGRS